MGYERLEDCSPTQVRLEQADPTKPLVEFADDGSCCRRDGVELLEQRDNPSMPDSYAGRRRPTAVAEVTYRRRAWYVLAARPAATPVLPVRGIGLRRRPSRRS